MELSLITPVAHLEYTSLLPGRFCIAPVAIKYPEYKEYFITASKQGYKVILDNGVFEEDCVSNAEYIDLARSIRASVLVVPDTINGNAKDNWVDAIEFAKGAACLITGIELMFVPQCEFGDPAGFKHVLQLVIKSDQFQWIGICRDAVYNAFGQWTQTTDQELNRFFFSAWAARFGFIQQALERGKKFHFLGLGDQIHLIQHHWYVSSMDTACLFYQAVCGQLLDDGGTLVSHTRRPKDYFDRNFKNRPIWLPRVEQNCLDALAYATKADRLYHQITKDRL